MESKEQLDKDLDQVLEFLKQYKYTPTPIHDTYDGLKQIDIRFVPQYIKSLMKTMESDGLLILDMISSPSLFTMDANVINFDGYKKKREVEKANTPSRFKRTVLFILKWFLLPTIAYVAGFMSPVFTEMAKNKFLKETITKDTISKKDLIP